MRLLTLLSLVLAQQASAHSGEHASSFYLAHLLSEHGLAIGLILSVTLVGIWALVLHSEHRD